MTEYFFQTYILFTRLFQWEKTSLTRKRLLVRIQYRVPYGAVAQLGEHFACTEGVVGSNPTSSTICGCSSIGRALRCQRKGCGIVPHHPLQYAALVDHLAQLPSKQQNRGKHSDAAPYIRWTLILGGLRTGSKPVGNAFDSYVWCHMGG